MRVNHDTTVDIVQRFVYLAESHEWDLATELGLVHFNKKDPDPELFRCIANLMVDAAKIEFAECYLQQGRARWPAATWLAWQYADLATRHRSFDIAVQRWHDVVASYPDFPLGLCGLADLYRKYGQEREASRLFEEAVARFPTSIWAACGNALSATIRHEWPEAVERWSAIRQQFPVSVVAHEQLIHAFLEGGDFAEAKHAAEKAGEVLSDHEKFSLIARQIEKRHARARATQKRDPKSPHMIPDRIYRWPDDLAVSPTPLNRVLIIGSCLAAGMPANFEAATPGLKTDFYLFNNGSVLPERPPHPPEQYSFQFVQISLRSVLPDASYFRQSYADVASYAKLFDDVCERLSFQLAQIMRWNHDYGILTFVSNFLLPQQNPLGRLLPRYDLRNFVYFIERLNEALDQELTQYSNAYLFDQDQIAATFGRRNFQDDILWTISHGALLGPFDHKYDQSRLEPVGPVSEVYPTAAGEFVRAVWLELQAMYRTLRQTDTVKLLLLDLDDTLWRGVVGEDGTLPVREGWPVGLVEALLFLKQRGVLLGVVSKNDEERVLPIWRRIWGDLLKPEDFAIRRINWRPKADNIEEILRDVNLLSNNVLFIDDNPVERASVKAAFPEMRVLGANPYLWRRILLWSAETQVPVITSESTARTEMVKAQVRREGERKRLTRAEFLASLDVTVSLSEIRSTQHRSFPRAFELINKTNQFNTTGRRWTVQEFITLFSEGAHVCTLEVRDCFTAYGIVGAAVVKNDEIIQFVMSCRTVGMDVELAAVAAVLASMGMQGFSQARASLVETAANLLCRDLWERCGFVEQTSGFYLRSPIGSLETPIHISMTLEKAEWSPVAAE